MSFEYSCFISYQRGQHKLAKKIINDLYEALSSEVELYIRDKKIYIDEDEICGGEFYNEKLAKSLCKSVCMIMVFTPAYFDKEHTYCAREFKAMEILEKERLEYLGERDFGDIGLIIPIVFRGKDYLPQEIKGKRQCYFFDSYMLFSEDICMHPEYAEKIRAIADQIYKISTKLEDLPEVFKNCDKFKLPSDEEIRDWLSNLKTTRMPFPGGHT